MIPVFERAKTVHALYRAATVIGIGIGNSKLKPSSGQFMHVR
jgi:hypothetical protein